MLLGRSRGTFDTHKKWAARWSEYCSQNDVEVKHPMPLEVCAFVGFIASCHGANEATKALTVVRAVVSDPAGLMKTNWHIASLVDGLKNLAECKRKPKVAVSFTQLKDMVDYFMKSKSLEAWEVRNVCFLFCLFLFRCQTRRSC